MTDYVIEMLNITKEFPGIKANDNVTLQLRRGEIHALLGENGAGKSTLMSVLFGLYQPEAGVIKKNGEVVKINSPNDATALNIGMVHQHFKLVDVFTVLDNIILGAEPKKGIMVDRAKARARIIELSDRYGLKVNPDAKIEDISVGMQQRVEILKVLYRGADILILDEPTAALDPIVTEEVYEMTAKLMISNVFAKDGSGIAGMGDLIIVTMLAGGMLEIIRVAGGLDYLIEKMTRRINGKRGAEFSIAALVSLANLCTANNTIAIITTGGIAKDIADKYRLDARKCASILDTFSCLIQGIIPYGAQLLMASGLAGISSISIVGYLYYPFVMGVCAFCAILFRFPRKYS